MPTGDETTLLLLEMAALAHKGLIHDGETEQANRIARLHNEILEDVATGAAPLAIIEEEPPVTPEEPPVE